MARVDEMTQRGAMLTAEAGRTAGAGEQTETARQTVKEFGGQWQKEWRLCRRQRELQL